MPNLFDPVSVGRLKLPNRLLMAPMTRSRASTDGVVTALTAEYYAQRASAGLIISESIQPSVIGQGYILTPGLHTADQVAGWRVVTDAVHESGGRIFAQLTHTGRIGHPSLYPNGELPLAPSAVASGEQLFSPDGMLDHPVPRAMTIDDISATVDDFATRGRNAIDAGFDGVELHGANGYLLHQFLADNTNLRTDALRRPRGEPDPLRGRGRRGGRRRHRRRPNRHPALARQPVQQHGGGRSRAALRRLAGVARSTRPRLRAPGRGRRPRTDQAASSRLARHARPQPPPFAGSVPRITPTPPRRRWNPGSPTPSALATMWLANPDLDARIKAGGPFNTPDPATFYGGDHRGYTDYPTLDQAAPQ